MQQHLNIYGKTLNKSDSLSNITIRKGWANQEANQGCVYKLQNHLE